MKCKSHLEQYTFNDEIFYRKCTSNYIQCFYSVDSYTYIFMIRLFHLYLKIAFFFFINISYRIVAKPLKDVVFIINIIRRVEKIIQACIHLISSPKLTNLIPKESINFEDFEFTSTKK